MTARPSVAVRDLAAGDLEAAWALDQDCFEPGIAYSRAEIRSFVSRPGAIALAAESGGRLLGFAIAERRGSRGYIVTIDVAEAARRRGLGRRLFGEILRRLADDGARRIRLEVDVRNAGAIRFYEELGFEKTRVLRALLRARTGRFRNGAGGVRVGESDGDRQRWRSNSPPRPKPLPLTGGEGEESLATLSQQFAA